MSRRVELSSNHQSDSLKSTVLNRVLPSAFSPELVPLPVYFPSPSLLFLSISGTRVSAMLDPFPLQGLLSCHKGQPSSFKLLPVEGSFRAPSAIAIQLLQCSPAVQLRTHRQHVIRNVLIELLERSLRIHGQSNAPRPDVLKDQRVLLDHARRGCVPIVGIVIGNPLEAL